MTVSQSPLPPPFGWSPFPASAGQDEVRAQRKRRYSNPMNLQKVSVSARGERKLLAGWLWSP